MKDARKRWTWKTEQTDYCLHTLFLLWSPALESEKLDLNLALDCVALGKSLYLLEPRLCLFVRMELNTRLTRCCSECDKILKKSSPWGKRLILAQGLRSFDP